MLGQRAYLMKIGRFDATPKPKGLSQVGKLACVLGDLLRAAYGSARFAQGRVRDVFRRAPLVMDRLDRPLDERAIFSASNNAPKHRTRVRLGHSPMPTSRANRDTVSV